MQEQHIACIKKDRQDARIAKIIDKNYQFKTNKIGAENAAIINNMTVDILENSYGKDYILLSKSVYNDLKTAKRENYLLFLLQQVILMSRKRNLQRHLKKFLYFSLQI